MSDPRPDSGRDSSEPDEAPADHRSGGAPVDDSGGIEANEVDPDLELIDPTGGDAA